MVALQDDHRRRLGAAQDLRDHLTYLLAGELRLLAVTLDVCRAVA